MRVAIIHDWLTGMRGGEKVLEIFCELFPDATLFTLLHTPGTVSETIEGMKIHTSFIQKLPGTHRFYRHYLPLFPLAVERFYLRNFDLVLSSSHCVALGGIIHPGCLHICYCYTPMRYAWDMYWDYFDRENKLTVKRFLMHYFLHGIRQWDVTASHRVDHFIGISHHVRRRIEKFYRRSADVIYPPVAYRQFDRQSEPEDFFLIVSALSPYKRLDLAIDACNEMNLPLRIIGSGPLERELKERAGPTISFLGWQSDDVVADHYARCRAFIFCGEEDFGITPLEAQAAGRPVIAYGAGGVLETVIPDKTGLFFFEQSVVSLKAAIEKFFSMKYDADDLKKHAHSFNRDRFKEEMRAFIEEKYDSFRRKEFFYDKAS